VVNGRCRSSALDDEWPLPGSEASLTAFRRRSRREVGRITTPSRRSAFSKPASQPGPDSANWTAPKRPLATSTYRPIAAAHRLYKAAILATAALRDLPYDQSQKLGHCRHSRSPESCRSATAASNGRVFRLPTQRVGRFTPPVSSPGANNWLNSIRILP